MKTITAFSLMLLLLLQAGGMLFFYKVRQFSLQQHMQAQLQDSRSHFQQLTLSLEAYQKYKISEDEIEIDGKLYDIKSVTISGNRVILYALNDSSEEALLEEIRAFLTKNHPTESRLPETLQQLIFLSYLPPATEEILWIPTFGKEAFCHRIRRLFPEIRKLPRPLPRCNTRI